MVASSASMTCCWNLQHRYTRCDAKNENLTKTSLNVVRTCVDMFGPCDWDRIVIHYADCQPKRLEVPFRFCHSLTSMIYMPRKFTRTGWTSKSIQDVRNGRGPAHGDESLGPFLHNQLPSTSTSLHVITCDSCHSCYYHCSTSELVKIGQDAASRWCSLAPRLYNSDLKRPSLSTRLCQF